MDQKPHNNESGTFKLPEVQPELKDASQGFESVRQNIEDNSMSQAVEQNSLNNQLNSANPQQQSDITPVSLTSSSTLLKTIGSAKKIAVTDDLPASDSDLIEKAWVAKAKAIVEQTKNDPYEQTNEFKKIRADYQNKRFNTNPKKD